jgi:hypothetical protein
MLLYLVSLIHATSVVVLFGANKTVLTGFSMACLIVAWLGTRGKPGILDFTVESLLEVQGRSVFVGTVFLCLTAGVNIWALLLLISKLWFATFSV